MNEHMGGRNETSCPWLSSHRLAPMEVGARDCNHMCMRACVCVCWWVGKAVGGVEGGVNAQERERNRVMI